MVLFIRSLQTRSASKCFEIHQLELKLFPCHRSPFTLVLMSTCRTKLKGDFEASPSNLTRITISITSAWANFTSQLYQKVEFIPTRLSGLIRAKGGPTPYKRMSLNLWPLSVYISGRRRCRNRNGRLRYINYKSKV